MTIGELISILNDYQDDIEVRVEYSGAPSEPLPVKVGQVVYL